MSQVNDSFSFKNDANLKGKSSSLESMLGAKSVKFKRDDGSVMIRDDSLKSKRKSSQSQAGLPPAGIRTFGSLIDQYRQVDPLGAELPNTFNCICVIIQVNPVQKVQTKFGYEINLSSVLAADLTNENFKISLWGSDANWIESINPGDIVKFSKLKVTKWKNEVIASTLPMRTSSMTVIFSFSENQTDSIKKPRLSNETLDYAKYLRDWSSQKFSFLFGLSRNSLKPVLIQNRNDMEDFLTNSKEFNKIRLSIRGKIEHSEKSLSYPVRMFLVCDGMRLSLSIWQDSAHLLPSLAKCSNRCVELTHINISSSQKKHDLTNLRGLSDLSLHTTLETQVIVMDQNDSVQMLPYKSSSRLDDPGQNVRPELKELSSFHTLHESGTYLGNFTVEMVIFNRGAEITEKHDLIYLGCSRCRDQIRTSNGVSFCRRCPILSHDQLNEVSSVAEYFYYPIKVVLVSKDEESNLKHDKLVLHVPSGLVGKLFGDITPNEIMKSPTSNGQPNINFYEEFKKLARLITSPRNSAFQFTIRAEIVKKDMEIKSRFFELLDFKV
jgi:hypothetical protein